MTAPEDALEQSQALLARAIAEPELVAPLARELVRALRNKAHAARLSYLRQAGAAIVESLVPRHFTGTNAPSIPITARAVAPDYLIESIRLADPTLTLDAIVEFFADRKGRVLDFELGTIIYVVAHAYEPQRDAADIMKTSVHFHRLQSGLDELDGKAQEAGRDALFRSAHTLPLDEFLEIVIDGDVMHIDVDKFRTRPELADPMTCIRVLETLQTLPGAHTKTEAFLVERLGVLRYTPAAYLIALMALRTTAASDHLWVALVAIGGVAAREAIVSSMRRAVTEKRFPWDAEHSAANLRRAARTLLALETDDPFELFAPFFTAEALSTGFGAVLSREILSSLHGQFLGRGHAVTHLADPRHAANPVLTHDPRWVALLVGLASHPRLGAIAESLLENAEPGLKKAAIEEALVAARARVIPAAAVPKRVDYLARYLAGKHDEVWDDLRALGVNAADPAIADEVRAVAEEAMRRVRKNVETLLTVLRKSKVPVEVKSKALQSPKPKLLGDLDRYELDRGLKLPATLRALYLLVGAVDFRPTIAWPTLNRSTPLSDGEPLSLLTFLPGKTPKGYAKRAFPALLRAPEALRLGHDPSSRSATERVLYVVVDRPVADPPLLGLTEETLIGYLRRSLWSAGFAGGTRAVPAEWTKGLIHF